MIPPARQEGPACPDSLSTGNELAGPARVRRGDEERLGQKTLDPACPCHEQRLLRRELLPQATRYSLLNLLVLLQPLPDPVRHVIVLLPDDGWVKDARRREERIHRG